MSLKKIYYYLFYKLYKIAETLGSDSLTEMKAGIIVMAMETWLLFSIYNYWDLLLNQHSKLEFFSFKILLPGAIIIITKWFAFVRDNTWKRYFEEFDQWPKDKNRKGTYLIIFFIIILFANLVFSSYICSPDTFRW